MKGIIFDLDGVIVSTDHYHYLAWKDMSNSINIDFNEKTNDRLRGVSRRESLEIILSLGNISLPEEKKLELMNKKNNYYVSLLDNISSKDILPGVLELLNYLKNNNYKVAIGSSSKNTKKILEKIGLLYSFDAIADGTDIINSKPAPDVFLVASKKLNLNPSECMVIEDAIAGIEAAKAAGMFAVGIKDATNCNLCDLKVSSMQDIIYYLNNN